MTGRLARYGLSQPDLLGPAGLGWWDAQAQAPVDAEAGALLAALSDAADPDLALRQLCRLVEAAARTGVPDPRPELRRDAGLRRRLFAVLGASAALGDHLAGQPGDWMALASAADGSAPAVDGQLDPPSAADPDPATSTGPVTVAGLRRAYRRALLRIAAADLTGGAALEPVMAALTRLADATLAAAYDLAVTELPAGTPVPRLAVVAMGKCGGGELNYVSDVDVVFVAATDADLPAATRVAARVIEVGGLVAWPVDAALRPEGSRGPLVRTVASYLAYYRRWARTWEFQALLKARPAAGDRELAQRWLAAVDPFVWQAAERPEAVEDVRAMRRRIVDNVPAAQLAREIKRGSGGLRDIEFAVQLLQLVHGRADESLRVAGTLPALRALVAGGYVGRADGEALLRGYRFLRAVEHRLQLQALRRTHTVPEDPAALRWLAHALGYTALPGRGAVEAFRADWVGHAAEVRRLHAKLLYRPLLEAVARVPAESLRLSPQAAGKRLELLGFADPPGALRHLEALTGGVSRKAAIQRTLLPVLLQDFADAPEPDRGLLAYRQVSDALGGTPWYLRLLRDSGPVARRLARQLGLSRYVTGLLTRDPEALRLLADDAELTPRPVATLCAGFAAAADRHLDGRGGLDSPPVRGDAAVRAAEAAIGAVRALRRRELFRIACADVLSEAGPLAPAAPLDVTAVGAALSAVADATLAAALRAATAAHPGPPGLRFAVIGMGRLGGYEMSYPSDADVLFVYDMAENPPSDVDGLGAAGGRGTGGRGPSAAGAAAGASAAHAIAEELRRLLGMPAPDPPLGVDADLRPEGRQGPLVRSLAAYAQYYARWSRVWEAQALLRARYVCGDPELAGEFLAMADRIRYPAGGLTREQTVEIRRIKARVETERLPRGADPATHTKLGRGGLADVEWAVQVTQLRHAHAVPGLRNTRTLAALGAASDAGLVDAADAAALAAGWVQAARVRNALTLVRGRPGDQLPRHGPELAGVVRLLGGTDPGEFVDEYLRTARHGRAAAERVLAG
ncbi:MAG TPA: bifunctional [glutamine synthetase] adenylyltransferase/[glutamine synthetase]-adenylyl-L-tyrosine phosphorylase [Pilimelia sp.]|nr:bifunctional [glutamine synthetase] adenylyltransferase/[glutamine synthetase]-adenylyl-L-tyrosine phosphorylase [Pilimelia sp.]